jgi:O-6-methylguanine DNA methyltransferase
MDTIVYGFSESPFGSIIVARTPRGICDVQFLTYQRMEVISELGKRWGVYTPTTQDDRVAKEVVEVFFEHKRQAIILDLQGTDFQKLVWRELKMVPFGHTATYQDIANLIGKPKAVRAVASAIAQNPIALLIPCHRIVHSDGTIGKYHWGSDLKKKLIDWERKELQRLGDEPTI